MGLDSQIFDSYVPVYDVIPDEWNDAKAVIVEQLKKLANEVDIREIGWFLDQEVLTGKAFIPTEANITQGSGSSSYRTILRIVVNTGALPNAGTKSVPHNIVFDSNFSLIQIYLSATDPVNLKAFGLMYWANSVPGSIILNMDATNVNITTTSNYSSYTRSYVVIEYIQEL